MKSTHLRTAAYVAIALALAMLVVLAVLAGTWRRCVECCAANSDCAAGQRCAAATCTAGSPDAPSMFADTGDLGGLLGHMMQPEDLQAALTSRPFSFGLTSQGVADCAAINRKTCSAWTYLRRDLPPMIFIYPTSPASLGYWTPLCGVLLDPRLAWPLVASMSVIDSDTDVRSCCGNEVGQAFVLRSSDDPQGLTCVPSGIERWVLYLPSDAVGSCPTSCPASDPSCRSINAGGGVNVFDLLSWGGVACDCIDWTTAVTPSAVDLTTMQQQTGSQLTGYSFYTLQSCPLCSGPYVCSTQPLAGGADYVVTPGGARAYVGAAGERFGQLFYSTDWANFSLASLMNRQCKWPRSAWPQWVAALKAFYQQVAGSFVAGNALPPPLSYLQANPCALAFNENEVNLYVDPSQPDDATFRAAIVGFFWVSTTCTDQLAALEGVTSTAAGCTYTDVKKRCNDFMCPRGTTCPEASADVADQRRTAARDAVRQMVAQFNATYRVGGTPVVAYSATPSSNSFFDKATLDKASAGAVAFTDVFTVDTGA